MHFRIVGALAQVETIATGNAIREIQRLRRVYNEGYEVSLERRKIYRALPDRDAAAHDQLRVIDESGEDYLYPASLFAPIALPPALRRAVLAAV